MAQQVKDEAEAEECNLCLYLAGSVTPEVLLQLAKACDADHGAENERRPLRFVLQEDINAGGLSLSLLILGPDASVKQKARADDSIVGLGFPPLALHLISYAHNSTLSCCICLNLLDP